MAPIPNPKVFLDIAIGRRAVGRLRFELFHDVLPITSENFRALCTGETGLGYWFRPRWYKGVNLHRVVPGFMCQGGDFNYGKGYMGESIYGQNFRDERFCYKHSKRGVLGMAHNGKKNFCNSQFYMTFAPCPWLDGKHVVFGHVIDGFEVLDEIEAVGSEIGKPHSKVWVHDCGEEDRLLLRRTALPEHAVEGACWATPQTTAEKAAEAAEAAGGYELGAVERPEPLEHVKQISPVPDEVWRRAKARRDNML